MDISHCQHSQLNMRILQCLVDEAELLGHMGTFENIMALEGAKKLDHVALVVRNKNALLDLQERLLSIGGCVKRPVHLWPVSNGRNETVHWKNKKYMLEVIVQGLLVVGVAPVRKSDCMGVFLGACETKIHHLAILVDNLELSVAKLKKNHYLKSLGSVAEKPDTLKQVIMEGLDGRLVEIVWRKNASEIELDIGNTASLSESLRVNTRN